MALRKGILTFVLMIAMGTLAACDSAKERAQKHLASAMELLQAGDVDRAVVELRNVFKLDDHNREARIVFAGIMEKRGNQREAYAQYRRVIEQNPEDIEAIKAAARIAASMSNWPEAGRQATAGLALAPEDLDLMAVKAAVDYASAVTANDTAASTAAAQKAQDLMVKLPENLLLRRVVINDLIRAQKFDAAGRAIDAAIKIAPREKDFYLMRLSVLATEKDDAGIEQQLRQMVKVFPEDPSMRATLVRWYVSHGDIDKAEADLRAAIDEAGDDPAPRLTLINFLAKYRSPDVALAELDKIIAAAPALNSDAAKAKDAPEITLATFRALRASILFDQGKRDEAIKEMETITATDKPTDETRKIEVALARMQFTTGNAVGARALVEKVLSEDKGQVEALKLKAAWLIDDDATDDAIALLRTALDATPKDPQIMTLMAKAYERAGNTDLVGDMLSQAVEASNKAPEESIRYATFLAGAGKYLPAESVLIDALRLDATNIAILAPLGKLYIDMKDWPRATGVADRLEQLGTPEAVAASHALRPAILQGQKKPDDAVNYLEGLAQDSGDGFAAETAIIQTYLANGDTGKALAAADALLAKKPKDPTLRFMNASVKAAAGDSAGAEAIFRDLLREDPKRLPVWVALVRQLASTGQSDAASTELDKALVVLPDAGGLLMMKAGMLEQKQDIDGAIAIYNQLYDRDSSNRILANNLASLLASYHQDDPASLERAYIVSRRLNGTDVPPFQDTYGWITYLRGNPEEAVGYLEPAAKGLPADPIVQFHLAEVYRALGRADEARAQYAKVLALVPENDSRAFVQTAREQTGAAAPAEGTEPPKN